MKRLLPTVERLINALPDDEPEKDYYLNRVRDIKKACGCKTGALFLLIAFVTYPIYVLLSIHNFWERVVFIVAQGFLILVASALLGKLIGIMWSKLELVFLHRKLSHIRRTWNAKWAR